MTSPHPILQEAFELITGTRDERYGDAWDDFGRQARLWSEVMHHPVTAQQVAMCMICTKLAREMHRPDYDNRLDLIGYAALLEYVTKRGAQPPSPPASVGAAKGMEELMQGPSPSFSHPDLEPQGLHPLPDTKPSHVCDGCGRAPAEYRVGSRYYCCREHSLVEPLCATCGAVTTGISACTYIVDGIRRYYCKPEHAPSPDTRTSA